MNAHADKTQGKTTSAVNQRSRSAANSQYQKQSGNESALQFVDNRADAIAQRKLQTIANNSPRTTQLRATQEMLNTSTLAKPGVQMRVIAENDPAQNRHPIQKKENTTGLPDHLKSGIENLSGMSLDDVKVHRNSAKPAQLQAHAYAQGTDIHLGPGQDKHLPHEAWHVAQQKQGRVKPTVQMNGKVSINVNSGLEKEADFMGNNALQLHSNEKASFPPKFAVKKSKLDSDIAQKKASMNVIQKFSDALHAAITKIGGYSFKDPFMQYMDASNQSPDAVNWKAHVGVQDANDRAQVMAEAGPVLRALGINHKFDIRDAENGAQFQKFVTIYPPAEERDWAEIIAQLESAITAPTYFDENAEAGVMGGKIAMRHGQIGAVLPAQIIEAGIALTKENTANAITPYIINDDSNVWDASYKNKLVFHAQAGTCFFLMEKPFPAIIWEGVLRPDRREDWNPFKAQLPEGVKTTEEIEWEEKIIAYRSSEMYRNREKALAAKGEGGRYG